MQLLAALQHVHEQHVIHRDVKPSNIMLTRDGKVKLVDFGVALIDEPNDETRTVPEIVGSPDYMAPEQMKTGLVDGRADLYSTGVILYELLTRKRAFQGYSRDRMPEPTGLGRAFHHPVDAVIFKALATDPNKRFRSAKEFQVALERAGRVNYLQALFASVSVVGPAAAVIYALSRGPVEPPPVKTNVGAAASASPNTHFPPTSDSAASPSDRSAQNDSPGSIMPPDTSDGKLTPYDAKRKFLDDCNAIVGGEQKHMPEPQIPPAGQKSFAIVTAPAGGTYYQFGSDIVRIASPHRVDLRVRATDGSKQNVELLVNAGENAALGIVKREYLQTLVESTDLNDKAKVRGLSVVGSLFLEEVHVLAKRTVKDIYALDRRPVVVGSEGLGSRLTAERIFRRLSIHPLPVDLPPAAGICAVLAGDADAMVYAAGKPVQFFQRLEKLKQRYPAKLDAVKLLAIQPNRLLAEYDRAQITSQDYHWLTGDVETLASRAILVSFPFRPGRDPYQERRCKQLRQLGDILRKKLPDFQQPFNGYHAKWAEVELLKDLPGFPRDECFGPAE